MLLCFPVAMYLKNVLAAGVYCVFQFWYFTYGTKDVLERECKDLQKKVTVSIRIEKVVSI